MKIALALGVLLIASVASAQGPHALNEASYAQAVADGQTKPLETFVNSPFVWRYRMADTFDPSLRTIDDFPYHVTILTPYSRLASVVANAKRRFEELPLLSLDAINADQVSVRVTPGTNFLTAASIEQLVVKRGDQIIKPIRANLEAQVVRNRLGHTKELQVGTFVFPYEAFAPGAVTIVFVGPLQNVEWTMRFDEVLEIR